MAIFEKYKTAINNTIYAITLLSVVSAALSGFVNNLQNRQTLFISIIIATACLLYVLINGYIKNTRIKNAGYPPNLDANQIRGLMPFEEGQRLIGRDREIKLLKTVLEDLHFQFGYVSGEVGAGKTSFIRAGLTPLLKQRDWQVGYFPSTNEILIDTGADRHAVTINPLVIEKLASAAGNNKIIIIIDQFEEFFISHPHQSVRTTLADSIAGIIQFTNIKFLLCLRKDFVEDLRSFAPSINDPKSDATSCYIKNWEPKEAKLYFDEICASDALRFSNALKDGIISDLSEHDIIRPIELQIVGKYCIENEIFQLADYRNNGRAKGILSNFVEEVINKTFTQNKPIETLAGKFLLRELCNDLFDTKRTDGGLTLAELESKTKDAILAYSNFSPEDAFFYIFEAVTRKLLKYKFILQTGPSKINLSHDYLARPIKQLTSELKTKEEKALSYITENLAKRKLGFNGNISLARYLFIKRNLAQTPYADINNRQYLHGQLLRFFKIGGVTALVLIVIGLFYFQPKITFTAPLEVSGRYYYLAQYDTTNAKNLVRLNDTTYLAEIRIDRQKQSVLNLYSTGRFEKRPDSIRHQIDLPNGFYYRLDKSFLSLIDTSRNIFRVYSFKNGTFSLLKEIKLPGWFDQKYPIADFFSKAGNNRSYDFLPYTIDYTTRLFCCANTAGFLVAKDYTVDDFETVRYKTPLSYLSRTQAFVSKKSIFFSTRKVNSTELSENSYVFDIHSERFGEVDSLIMAAFDNGRLYFDADLAHIYYADSNSNSVKSYSPEIPATIGDFGVPDDSIPLSGRALGACFNGYHNLGYINLIPTFTITEFDNKLDLVHLEATSGIDTMLLIDRKLMSTPLHLNYTLIPKVKLLITETKSGYFLIPMSKRSYRPTPYIYKIGKGTLAIDSIHVGPIVAAQEVDSSHIDLIYYDSAKILRLITLDKNTDFTIPSTSYPLYNLGTQEVGDFDWTEIKPDLVYSNEHFLQFGNKYSPLDEVLLPIEPINSFFTAGTELLLSSGKKYYVIKRRLTIFGIPVWTMNWPKVRRDYVSL